MLNAAGVLGGYLAIHAERGQKRGQYGVTLVNGFGDFQTGLGQTEQTVLVDGYIAVIAQQADGPADAGLPDSFPRFPGSSKCTASFFALFSAVAQRRGQRRFVILNSIT